MVPLRTFGAVMVLRTEEGDGIHLEDDEVVTLEKALFVRNIPSGKIIEGVVPINRNIN